MRAIFLAGLLAHHLRLSSAAGEDAERVPTIENETLFQGFEWHTPSTANHWRRLERIMPQLKAIGITNILLPPGSKAASPTSNGYDIADHWDVGEFDQYGGVATKWGNLADLQALAQTANETGIGLYWDAVFNQKMASEHTETCRVVRSDANGNDVGAQFDGEAWLGWDFPGRQGKYSDMKWHWYHFTGTDYLQNTGEHGIFRIIGEGKSWSKSVAPGKDFLLGNDIDHAHPEVQKDLLAFGEWIVKLLSLKGFRMDAVQHFSQDFTNNFMDMLETEFGKGSLLAIGEVFDTNVDVLTNWLSKMEHNMSLFDVPLMDSLSRMSKSNRGDLRTVFDKTFIKVQPDKAVTFVQNHDTQFGQACQSIVEDWFKPLAYALIMLRKQGYPTLFYGDLYGIAGEHKELPAANGQLSDIVLARHLYAYGPQRDHFNSQNLIGWVRQGTWDKPSGLACVMSNGEAGFIRMNVGESHAGEVWTDVLGWQATKVTIDAAGWGKFETGAMSLGIYVNEKAEGRNRFGHFDTDIYKGDML